MKHFNKKLQEAKKAQKIKDEKVKEEKDWLLPSPAMQVSYLGELMLRSSRSFIELAMFDLDLESTAGEGGGKAKRTILTAPEPSSLLLLDRCSPQPSAAIKISDGSCNFHQDNTRHLPAKITPAPQANTSLKGTSRNLAIRTPVCSQVQKSKNTYHSTWFYCKLTSQWFVLGSRHHEYINERDTAFPLVRSIDCTLTNETTGQNLVHYLLQERENLVGFLAVISLLMKTIPCLQ